MGSTVDAMKNMSTSLESELNSMLVFFGEKPESPEAPKPEDFFGMILSFSSVLQVGSTRDISSPSCAHFATESRVRGPRC